LHFFTRVDALLEFLYGELGNSVLQCFLLWGIGARPQY
jgi:hypothetical protein